MTTTGTTLSKSYQAIIGSSPMDAERFWRLVSKNAHPKGCWLWLGTVTEKDYGLIYIKGQSSLAHRMSFFLANLRLSPDLLICHTCDNPRCVNPAHLFEGTSTDNVRDSIQKGRFFSQKRTHCLHGHALVPENLHTDKYGMKRCRQCKRRHSATRYYKCKRESGNVGSNI